MPDFQPADLPELHAVLRDLLDGIRPILGEHLLGAYLQGSFAHGGWDRDSDVDFVVVVDEAPTEAHLVRLQKVHAALQEGASYWAHHLEGSYFPASILGDLSAIHIPLDYLDNGSLVFEKSTHDNSLVVRRVLRRRGVTLAGPPPETFIPPVPDDALRAEVWDVMQTWGEEILTELYDINNGWAQPFAVLSTCRMLQTLAVGDVLSKPDGADWAKAHLARRWVDLIEHALSQRKNQYQKCHQAAQPGRVSQTRAFIRYALDVGRARFGMG